jgi:hypothetical protein
LKSSFRIELISSPKLHHALLCTVFYMLVSMLWSEVFFLCSFSNSSLCKTKTQRFIPRTFRAGWEDELKPLDLLSKLPQITKKVWGGFHKSWAHGQKRRVHPNMGENAISWAQILSAGRKLLYEIHPCSVEKNGFRVLYNNGGPII